MRFNKWAVELANQEYAGSISALHNNIFGGICEKKESY
jgi:hypothetical protein